MSGVSKILALYLISVPQAKRVVKIFKFCGILDAPALEVHQIADAPSGFQPLINLFNLRA